MNHTTNAKSNKRVKGTLTVEGIKAIYTAFEADTVCEIHKCKKEIMLLPQTVCKKCLDEAFKGKKR